MTGAAGIADYRPLSLRQLWLRYRSVLYHQTEQTLSIVTAIAASAGAKPDALKKMKNPYA